MCNETSCLNGGTCRNNEVCDCRLGFEGVSCQIIVPKDDSSSKQTDSGLCSANNVEVSLSDSSFNLNFPGSISPLLYITIGVIIVVLAIFITGVVFYKK